MKSAPVALLHGAEIQKRKPKAYFFLAFLAFFAFFAFFAFLAAIIIS
jgi:hypothetical protein